MTSFLTTLLNTFKLFVLWAWCEFAGALGFYKRYGKQCKKHQLALLSFCLPPHFNSGTHRPLSFLKYAKENGWDIYGITNAPNKNIIPAGLELQKEIPDDIKVHFFSADYEDVSWLLTPKVDGGFGSIISMIIKAMDLFRKEPPAVILASGPPFGYVIAGFYLSRLFRRPLVLDYRDEWILCPFDDTSKTKIDAWFEKRCIRQAELISYTTKSHKDIHRKYFNVPESKQALIFNGWEEDRVLKNSLIQENQEAQKIKISYTGRLGGRQTPESFIKTLNDAIEEISQLRGKVKVSFIGEKTPSQERILDELIETRYLNFEMISLGLVPKSEALNIMQKSDYLLMLCNKGLETYIPGKVYDYLSCRKPIIAYGFAGEVTAIIEKLNAGIFVPQGDKKSIQDILVSNSRFYTDGEIVNMWLEERTRRNQAVNLFKQLDKI